MNPSRFQGAGTRPLSGRADTPHSAPGRPGHRGPRSPTAGPGAAAYSPQRPLYASSSRESRAALGEGGRPRPPPSPISRRRRVFSGLPSRTCVSSSGLKLAPSRSLRRSWFMVTTDSGGGGRSRSGGDGGGDGDDGDGDDGCPQLRRGPGPKSRPRRARDPAPARLGPPRPAPSPFQRPVCAPPSAAKAEEAPAWAP